MDAIVAIGCIACIQIGRSTHAEVHHQNIDGKAGQKCLGHSWTVGLCAWHHDGRQVLDVATIRAHTAVLGPSLKLHSRAFRAKFGTDAQLLAQQNELLARYSP